MKPDDASNQRPAGYVLGRLYLTIETLCLGPGDIRSRLETAARHHLIPVVRVKDFPGDLQEDYKWIIEQLTRYSAPTIYTGDDRDDRLKWTTQRIRRKTGVKIATRILALFRKVRDLESGK